MSCSPASENRGGLDVGDFFLGLAIGWLLAPASRTSERLPEIEIPDEVRASVEREERFVKRFVGLSFVGFWASGSVYWWWTKPGDGLLASMAIALFLCILPGFLACVPLAWVAHLVYEGDAWRRGRGLPASGAAPFPAARERAGKYGREGGVRRGGFAKVCEHERRRRREEDLRIAFGAVVAPEERD